MNIIYRLMPDGGEYETVHYASTSVPSVGHTVTLHGAAYTVYRVTWPLQIVKSTVDLVHHDQIIVEAMLSN